MGDKPNRHGADAAGAAEPRATRHANALLGRWIRHQLRTQRFVTATRILVSVVDDDESVRESLTPLLHHLGYAARAFASAEAFLESDAASQTACLILDVSLSGQSGLELQRTLARRRQAMPIVFITAHADESIRASALDAGAVEFLYKPFSEAALLDALQSALGAR